MKKTTLLLTLLFVIFSGCYSQEGYTITGHITGYKDGTRVKLQSFEEETFEDYTTIQNNTFFFKGSLDNEAERFLLTFDNGRMNKADQCILFIGNENVVITADKRNSSFKATIKGSKYQDIQNKINEQIAIIEPEYAKMDDEYRTLKRSSSNQDSIQNRYHGENGKITLFAKKHDSIYKNFIRENYNSYPALEQLFFRRDKFEKKEILGIYGKLEPALKNSRFGKAIKLFLERPQLKEGDRVYDFEATDAGGKIHHLLEYLNKGKYILLEFTKPICGPSRQAIPVLKDIATERQNDLKILSLTIKDKTNWKKINEKEKIDYTRLFTNENGFYGETVIGYGIYSTPTFLLVSPSGQIIKKFQGIPKDFKSQLYSYIK